MTGAGQPGADEAITLYYAPRSSALAARLILDLAGVDYRLIQVNLALGEQRSPSYLAMNAFGRVPMLKHRGMILTENVGILVYLARCFPQLALLPADPLAEARCLEWLGWGASVLHPALAHERKPERYVQGVAARADVAETARRSLQGLFAITEARLARAPWAAGEAMSVADLYGLFFWLRGAGLTGHAGSRGHLSVLERHGCTPARHARDWAAAGR